MFNVVKNIVKLIACIFISMAIILFSALFVIFVFFSSNIILAIFIFIAICAIAYSAFFRE